MNLSRTLRAFAKYYMQPASMLVILIVFIAYIWFFYKRTRSKEYYYNSVNDTGKKAAIIVEPRKHPLLISVLDNFHARLDTSWDMYVFYGNSNAEYAKEAISAIKRDGSKRRIISKSLDTDNLSAEQYNKLFKDPAFWNQIDAEHILVFQTDAVSCANSQQSIDSFLKFGYIGCSSGSAIGVHPASYWGGNDRWFGKGSMKKYPFYGVGGLSLRKKSFTLDCITKMSEYPAEFPEDVFYSICVERPENKDMCPQRVEEIQDFCTQGSYDNQHKSWGAHKTNETIPESSSFYEFCPEAKIIFKS